MSMPMFDGQDSTKRDPEELLPWEDQSRDYRAMRGKRIGGHRVLFIQFVPNAGTHKRRLGMASLYLMDIANDGSELLMEFPDQTVVATGRNLDVVENGIAGGWIAALEAFNPARRNPPADPDAPFIARISFHPRARPQPETKRPVHRPKHEPETERAKN